VTELASTNDHTGSRFIAPVDSISLVDVVTFIRRNIWRIIGPGLVAALLTALVVGFLVPPHWQASVTLVVVPPKITSQLSPTTLTVQGYEQLLKSSSVVDETKRLLVEEGTIDAGARLRVGRELRTNIFVARREETTALAPLIQAYAQGRNQAQSAAIVNTWAEVFLRRVRGVMSGATDPVLELVEANYSEARMRLQELEDQLVSEEHTFRQRYDKLALRWDLQFVDYEAETASVTAAYSAETAKILGEYLGEYNIETKKVRLTAIRKTYSKLQSEQAQVSTEYEKKLLEFEASREQLEKTDAFITLRKTITEDALWSAQSGAADGAIDWERLKSQALVSEEVNPVFVRLLDRASLYEVEANVLKPRAEQLKKALENTALVLKEAETAYQRVLSEFEELKELRGAGAKNLLERRKQGLRELERQRDQLLNALECGWEMELTQQQRDIDIQRTFFGKLAESYQESLVARSETSQNLEDIRLLGPSPDPDVSESRGTVTKAVVAGLLFGILGLFWALVREAAIDGLKRSSS
jgi:capsular polysaccharide biosynthesis protein